MYFQIIRMAILANPQFSGTMCSMQKHRHHHKGLRIYRSRGHLILTIVVLLVILAAAAIAVGSRLNPLILLRDVGISCIRLFFAYILAVSLAWLCAVSFYEGKRSIIALPVFDVLQSFPTFALLPLATLVFGHTTLTVILFLIITIIWPIFFSVISSLKLARPDWREAVQISGLRGWSYVRLYLWPVTVPGLITGSVIGLGEGWEALVATEMIVGVERGLGPFFNAFAHNPAVTALAIMGLLLLIFTINKILWLPLLDWGHHTIEE